MTKVSYIIECLKGNILSNLDAKSNLITMVRCKCECGNEFDLQIGHIEVQGKWCDHSGIRENNKLVMSKNNFYSRLIYAIANYLINGVSDYTEDDLFYHTVLPNICVVIGYVPLSVELDSDALADDGINSLLFGFDEMVEISYTELKELIYKFIVDSDIQIHSNAVSSLNGFLGSAYVDPNTKLIRLAMNYTSYEDYKAKEAENELSRMKLAEAESNRLKLEEAESSRMKLVTVYDNDCDETPEEINNRLAVNTKKEDDMRKRLSKLMSLSKAATSTPAKTDDDDASNLMKNMLNDE